VALPHAADEFRQRQPRKRQDGRQQRDPEASEDVERDQRRQRRGDQRVERPRVAGAPRPDLVERLATGARLAEIDWPTVYGSGRRGYSDYPTLDHAMA